MPGPFDRCVDRGGRVRTLSLSGGRYQHICWLGSKSYAGHVKKKQTQRRRTRRIMRKKKN
jgi:hypothetical protein